MKPLNKITNEKKQVNIHYNKNNIEEKSDNYNNNTPNNQRLSKYNESKKNKLNNHKINNNNNAFVSISDFPGNNEQILDNNKLLILFDLKNKIKIK